MCCLFGLIDYRNSFSGKQKTRMLSILATECEARGTDATGIAFNSGGQLRIYKRPLPAHKMRFFLPDEVDMVMGHTRMTTQGTERKNFNNHPFRGLAGTVPFALAHNGIIRNDHSLRRAFKLPSTDIQTDSYIAVQLLEQKQALDFNSLRYMAEHLEGSFTFTLLDSMDNLYIVKGDNPFCLYHFPAYGLYLYASTEEILCKALKQIQKPLDLGPPIRIKLSCGELLRIGANGAVFYDSFDATNLCWTWWPIMWASGAGITKDHSGIGPEIEYCDALKTVARAHGYTPEMIDRLLDQGFTTDELEDMLYSGEL